MSYARSRVMYHLLLDPDPLGLFKRSKTVKTFFPTKTQQQPVTPKQVKQSETPPKQVQQTVVVKNGGSGCSKLAFFLILLIFGLFFTVSTGGLGIILLVLGFPIALLIMAAA